MAVSVLVVEDDSAVAAFCRDTLVEAGHRVSVASSASHALEVLEREEIDVVLSDVRMPGMDGTALLRSLKATGHSCDVVLMTGYGTVDSAVDAVKLGAYDYILKPFSPERLQTTIHQLDETRALRFKNSLLEFRSASERVHGGLIGASSGLMNVLASVVRVAKRPHAVLISGETGTGKELVARAIHELGCGKDRPFVPVECGALSENVVESELFGHVRGAYTGASGDRPGLAASSAGGTLFLDEVGELPVGLQVKLLRMLQEKEFRPVGGDRFRRFEGRVIAATNRDLERASAEGSFRPDLFYRLNVYRIMVPPLRERREDIPILIQHFIEKYGEGRVLAISPDAKQFLASWLWPGNVRELENCLIGMIASCDGQVLQMRDVPQAMRKTPSAAAAKPASLKDAERMALLEALESAGGSVADAAKNLNLSKATLYRKINTHGLQSARSRVTSESDGPS